MRVALWITRACVLVSLAACVADPVNENPISVATSPSTIVADGASLATLTISAESDGDIELTASLGSFLNASAPTTGGVAATTVRTSRQSTTLTFRSGLTTGTAVIVASAGTFVSMAQIELTASLPTEIVLTPNRTSVTGDGVSYVELRTDLFAKHPEALVSRGTALRYAACCVDSLGQPTDCASGTPPLAIPSIERVGDEQGVVVRAVSMQTEEAATVILLARVDDPDITGSLCAAPAPGEVRSNQLLILITPQKS